MGYTGLVLLGDAYLHQAGASVGVRVRVGVSVSVRAKPYGLFWVPNP